MKKLLLVLLCLSAVACVGPSKTKQNISVFDFGVPAVSEPTQRVVSETLLDEVSATDAVNHQQIRYRLNAENPSRVFAYTESRWATTPAELLNNRLGGLVQQGNKSSACTLKLKVQVFDHVFKNQTDSEGVVQLSGILLDKKNRKVIASGLISEASPATSANAQGGAKALAVASDGALLKAVNWANAESAKTASCRAGSQ